eukprot:8281128-Alexandrium_andersonii.AAC.1
MRSRDSWHGRVGLKRVITKVGPPSAGGDGADMDVGCGQVWLKAAKSNGGSAAWTDSETGTAPLT